MKLFRIFILCILCLVINYNIVQCQKAIITVPVADLMGQQITTLVPNTTAATLYARIPVCAGEIKSSIACPRLHQLVYNDIVEIIKIVDDEVCISIPNSYYLNPPSTQPQHAYWTLKNNITLLDDLTANGVCITHIPQPITFAAYNTTSCPDQEIVTLIEPHYDATLRMQFSAGTRFVKTETPPKRRSSTISVFAINFGSMKEQIIKLPQHKCIIYNDSKTLEERIADYVTLLHKWAHTKNGSIAYVWGGTSFTKPTSHNFKEITKTGHNGDYSFYEYEKDTQSPKNGFDCSGAILRAAQISGIPYFCKNTTTIAQCLAPLTKEETLHNGDLILIKGHVMVVSDIDKNLLIEARGYNHGYGKLHEIPLNQVFEGIETYNDLCNAFHEKKVVKRKDKNGKIRDTFSNLQLFSMMSTWK